MQPQGLSSLTRKRLIFGILLFVLLIIVWVTSNYSVLSVQVTSGSSGKLQYQLLDQSSKQSTVITTDSSNVTRVVKKASYQVTVTQAKTSAFVVTKTKGFFLKTTAQAELVPEPGGKFVGNGAQACMYYVDSVLYSYNCGGSTTKTTHVPATATTPTYNLNSVDGVFGSYEDVVGTSEGTLALFNTADGHTVYVMNSNVKSGDGIALKDLDSNKEYSLAAYKVGFIAYDSTFSSIMYYSSTSAKPETISITKPADLAQKPLSLSASGDTIAVAYSDKADFEDRSDPNAIGNVKSEVFLYKDGQIKKYSFAEQYSSITPCGTGKLCLLDTLNKQLSIYEAGKRPKFLYSVEGVNSVKSYSNSLLAIRDDNVINLNVDKMNGYVVYWFNDYKFCGLNNSTNNTYLLCVANPKGQNSVLFITPGTTDTENLDEKVSRLLDLPEVASVSAYGNYVFISANVGGLVYNSARGRAEYDPTLQKAATDKINQEIDQLGRGSSTFVITNGSK